MDIFVYRKILTVCSFSLSGCIIFFFGTALWDTQKENFFFFLALGCAYARTEKRRSLKIPSSEGGKKFLIKTEHKNRGQLQWREWRFLFFNFGRKPVAHNICNCFSKRLSKNWNERKVVKEMARHQLVTPPLHFPQSATQMVWWASDGRIEGEKEAKWRNFLVDNSWIFLYPLWEVKFKRENGRHAWQSLGYQQRVQRDWNTITFTRWELYGWALKKKGRNQTGAVLLQLGNKWATRSVVTHALAAPPSFLEMSIDVVRIESTDGANWLHAAGALVALFPALTHSISWGYYSATTPILPVYKL